MTIATLKGLIADLPDHYQVMTEGCDCLGEASDVLVMDSESILIERKDGYRDPI